MKTKGSKRVGCAFSLNSLLNLQPTLASYTNTMKYRIIIEQDKDGIFIAEIPSLPSCISQGDIRLKALANIREAIEVNLEGLATHGEPVPLSTSEEIIEINV